MDDGESIEVICIDTAQPVTIPGYLADVSRTIKDLKEEGAHGAIILKDMPLNVLELVVQYCRMHKDLPPPPVLDLSGKRVPDKPVDDCEADLKFTADISWEKLWELTHAANYLHIHTLLDLTTRAIGKIILSKENDKQIYQLFNVDAPLTDAEIAATREENPWIEDRPQ